MSGDRTEINFWTTKVDTVPVIRVKQLMLLSRRDVRIILEY